MGSCFTRRLCRGLSGSVILDQRRTSLSTFSFSGQSLWQVLPLGPTGYGDSPYACYSAFAGNTLLISPESGNQLKDLLADLSASPAPITQRNSTSSEATNLKIRFSQSLRALQKDHRHHAAQRFRNVCARTRTGSKITHSFRALKDAHGGVAWNEWEPRSFGAHPLRWRARDELREEIEAQMFYQFLSSGSGLH